MYEFTYNRLQLNSFNSILGDRCRGLASNDGHKSSRCLGAAVRLAHLNTSLGGGG